MRRPWFPNYGEPPTEHDNESGDENEARKEAESELYAGLEARECAEMAGYEAES